VSATLAQKRDVVRVCRLLYERGLIAGPDGNVSLRLPSGGLLVTPAGSSKGSIDTEDLVETSLADQTDQDTTYPRPTTEIAMHRRIYQRRPDVHAVVHAHPPTATGMAVAGESIPDGVLPEVILQMGRVALVPYATPGTSALPDSLEPFLDDHDAFLLANHGATTVGPTLTVAHQRMESLEHAARIMLVATMLGKTNKLSEDEVLILEAVRRRAALPGLYPGSAPSKGHAEST
jgi:L-fuculose-phosphate aldolase